MRMLRPLRLFVPFVAVGAALLVFLVFGFLAYQGGPGGGSSGRGCGRGAAVGKPVGRDGDTAATLNDEQRQNAATIIRVAQQKGAPPRAWLVALATAKQESDLINVNYGDRDSLGLFQQRPSQGWGTPAQVLDPVYSTTTFLAPVAGARLGAAAGHRRRADRAAVGVPRRLRQVGGAGGRPHRPARRRDGPGGLRTGQRVAARGCGPHGDPVRARRARQALRVGGD